MIKRLIWTLMSSVLKKADKLNLSLSLWSAPEQTVEQIIETSVIWNIIALIMMLLSWSDYTFDVVSQSNSTTQIAEQRQIVINRYLSWHCRCRNQISNWHWMADAKKCWKKIFDTNTIWSFMHCNQIMTDAVSLLRYDGEQEVDRPVI